MAWTDPKTWVAGDALTASLLNTEVKDNLNYLKGVHAEATLNETSDYTTTSTTFVDVDATEGKLQLTVTTNGGDVLVHFHGAYISGATALFDIKVDGTRDGGNDGYTRIVAQGPLSFTRLITGLAADSHIFKLVWRVVSGTGTLAAGAGTANMDVHPQFWVREIS